MTLEIAFIIAGSFVGGFVNGMTGFGTALTTMPFYLLAVTPPTAAMLAAVLSVAGQAQTLLAMWRNIVWRRVLPMLAGGLIGIPVGTWLLPHVSVSAFKMFVGLVLIGYCTFMLLGGVQRRFLPEAGPSADFALGVASGVMGGLAALSGVLPAVWASLQNWRKDERRVVFMTFNGTILSVMLISSWLAGLVTQEFGRAVLWALPAAVAGGWLGSLAYRRLDDRRFDRIVLALLLLAGVALVLSSQAELRS